MQKNEITAADLIKSHKYWRLVECLPGTLVWLAFFTLFIGSIYFPKLTANLIILYTFIWLYRAITFSLNLTKSYQYSTKASNTDWSQLLEIISNPQYIKKPEDEEKFESNQAIFSNNKKNTLQMILDRIQTLKQKKQYLNPNNVIHCITLVTYKEPLAVIKSSIDSIINSNYQIKKQVILMMAFEESDIENATNIENFVKQNYSEKYKEILFSYHPKNIAGEIKGRAANATYAARELKKYLELHKIKFENLILSSLDADTVISKNYLNELTFKFCITLDRVKRGFQPIPQFHNNIWDVPVFNRLIAISCSFWQMAVSVQKNENKSFSSRAMSFQSVIDFDYWDTTVVQDDSRQFWTAFFIYEGDHHLETIYSPVYMDAVLSNSYLETLKSQYIQLRRWAWGASDLPFIVFNIFKSKKINLYRKLYEIIHFIESVFFWATGPIILLVAGHIPSIINNNFKNTVLAYNLPLTMSYLMNLASIGLVVCFLITLKIVPVNNEKKFIKKLSLILQWFLVPVVSIILSAAPAIDAQTRLLLNKRLDFIVTKKVRLK